MPERVTDTPIRVAWEIMQAPPKAEWDYLEEVPRGTLRKTRDAIDTLREDA